MENWNKIKGYDYLMGLLKKHCPHSWDVIFLKDPILIGKCHGYDMYANYFDRNDSDHICIWVIFNDVPDNLNGNKWDFTFLSQTNWDNREKVPVDNFITLIADVVKTYPEEWFEYYKGMKEKSRVYRYLTNNINPNKRELTWEERLDSIKIDIALDKLINRHKYSFEERTLNEMLELGEIQYKTLENKRRENLRFFLEKHKKNFHFL